MTSSDEPTIVALDTATPTIAVAISRGNKLLGELRWQIGNRHAERLIPSVEHLLQGAGIAWEEVDAVALSAGPGSFTGLRIGFGSAKGLVLAHDIPLILVSTLELLASQVPLCSHPVLAILDARMDEVYTALFDTSSGTAHRLSDDCVEGIESVISKIESKTCLVGSGWDRYQGLLRQRMGNNNLVTPAPQWAMVPSAAVLASLAKERFEAGEFDDPDSAAPTYLRRSYAESALLATSKG